MVFTPGSEYEFIVDGEKLYRVPTNKITIKYEYQGNEKEYNPSWASKAVEELIKVAKEAIVDSGRRYISR